MSLVGTTMTSAALPYQVFHETGSSLAVGLLGLAQLGPLLLFSVVGGALADSHDKRRLLLGVTAPGSDVRRCSPATPRSTTRRCGCSTCWAPLDAVLACSYPALRSLLPCS